MALHFGLFLVLAALAAVTTGRCIRSCKGMPDGDYQSCNGCKVYATCNNGLMYDNRPCPGGFVWDDVRKACEVESTTCRCIRSCKGMPDGSYQSCNGCKVYATCNNGVIYDNRPCPGVLVWDDVHKRCEAKSTTCRCIRSCGSIPNGSYQSCNGCKVYATCYNGVFYDDIPCPANLVWDDEDKMCSWRSTTCPEM